MVRDHRTSSGTYQYCLRRLLEVHRILFPSKWPSLEKGSTGSSQSSHRLRQTTGNSRRRTSRRLRHKGIHHQPLLVASPRRRHCMVRKNLPDMSASSNTQRAHSSSSHYSCSFVCQDVHGHHAPPEVRRLQVLRARGRCSLAHFPEYRSLRTETTKTIGDWIFEDILCRWGTLCEIVTDNGRLPGEAVPCATYPDIGVQLSC